MDRADSTILVVEDDPEVNELVGAYVQIAGFRYRRALNGAAALEEARRHPPSLIVLDVMLPDLDGFEICRRLRGESATRHVPIILLTALDRDEYRVRGNQCGATLYMTKPFDPDKLLEALRLNGHPAR